MRAACQSASAAFLLSPPALLPLLCHCLPPGCLLAQAVWVISLSSSVTSTLLLSAKMLSCPSCLGVSLPSSMTSAGVHCCILPGSFLACLPKLFGDFTLLFCDCCRGAGTARSAAQQARDKAGDYGESAGRAAADAQEGAEQAGRTAARRGAQGTRWAAEQVLTVSLQLYMCLCACLCIGVCKLPFMNHDSVCGLRQTVSLVIHLLCCVLCMSCVWPRMYSTVDLCCK